MVTLVKETGAGLTNSNAYADVTDSDTYHDEKLYSTAWTGATADNKARSLIWATRLLDQHMNWIGVKGDENQALRWPRIGAVDKEGYYIEDDEMPAALVEATCEFARQLLSADPTLEPESLGISSVRAGDVSVNFDSKDRESRSVVPEAVQAILEGLGSADMPAGGWVPVVRV